jgi:hypothetical protein
MDVSADRMIDAGITSAVAGATAAGALMEAEVSGWLVPMVSAGLASLVGYFTARITTEREIGVITERENNHFLELMRRLDSIERKMDGQ